MIADTPNSLPDGSSVCPVCEKPCNIQAESDTVTPDSVQKVRRLAATALGSLQELERRLKEIEAKLKT
jgi:uncharacterized Zn finger protein (UPF0148 family)